MTDTYVLVDGNGDLVCDGLTELTARTLAQEWADDLGAPVWLGRHDDGDDGERFAPEEDSSKG